MSTPLMEETRSTQGDTSITVEFVPSLNAPPVQTDQPPASSVAPQTSVQAETKPKPETPKNISIITRLKIKREDEDEYDEPEGQDEVMGEGRVDLAELNFPGGPVSSRRRNERGRRGLQKIETWLEQGEAEQRGLHDQGSLGPIRVKVEDEPMSGIVVPESEMMVVDEEEEEQKQPDSEAKERRIRRGKRLLKGKSREEKEEMAREEIDTEILQNLFLGSNAAEVYVRQSPLTI
jgi:hypothetical protein